MFVFRGSTLVYTHYDSTPGDYADKAEVRPRRATRLHAPWHVHAFLNRFWPCPHTTCLRAVPPAYMPTTCLLMRFRVLAASASSLPCRCPVLVRTSRAADTLACRAAGRFGATPPPPHTHTTKHARKVARAANGLLRS